LCDLLIGALSNPKEDFLRFVQDITGNKELTYNEKVAKSEKMAGHRNVALCYFIKSFGNIENDPDEVLDFYFHMCSLEMNCAELSKSFMFLADHTFLDSNGEQILNITQSKRINAIMQSCGFYDESGEFTFRVGLPGKSGVGGGIIALHPNDYTIAVWSPKLNVKGNSYRGMKFLEHFTTETQSSIF